MKNPLLPLLVSDTGDSEKILRELAARRFAAQKVGFYFLTPPYNGRTSKSPQPNALAGPIPFISAF
jgi:hypothetical protein